MANTLPKVDLSLPADPMFGKRKPRVVETRIKPRRYTQNVRMVQTRIAPWQDPRKLHDEEVGEELLRAFSALDELKRRTHVVKVHSVECPFCVTVMTRFGDGSPDDEDREHMLDVLENNCTCSPIVMYTGASA